MIPLVMTFILRAALLASVTYPADPLASVTPPADPPQLDVCGLLYLSSFHPECVIFQPFEGDTRYYITDLLAIPDSLVSSAAVHFHGQIVACSPCVPDFPCITGAFSRCEPSDLGCGVLTSNGECTLWDSALYGPLLLLSPTSGHELGELVQALGFIDYNALSFCIISGALRGATFTDCPDTLSAVEPRTWGTLKNIFR
jgi:hypothetical protein